MIALLLATLVTGSLAAGQDPTVACFITISDGTEYCYYYPTIGYQCDIDVAQDTAHRNLSACNNLGLCYVPLSDDEEVCYYTAPYGYDCYYELIPALVANMTHCDLLKANSPPEISFGTTLPTVAEDTPLLISDIVINDLDARDSESEGKGYLLITIAATNAMIRFSPDDLSLNSATKGNAARTVMNNDKSQGGVEWQTGNGSWASSLQMQIRCDPLLNLLPAFEVQGTQDFNGLASVLFTANDQGNTGGTAEIRTATLSVTITAVNDPPAIVWNPTPPATLEDTPLTITGLKIYDVDSASVETIITVSKGTLKLGCEASTCTGVTVIHLTNGRQLKATGAVGSRVTTSSVLMTALSQLIYTPDKDVNDDTGIEQMNVTANDKSSYLPTTTSIVQIYVTPVNDPPVLIAPALLQTDEDVSIVGLNLTVTDVDTYYNQTVVLTVQHGLLSLGAPYMLGPSSSITLKGSLDDLAYMFRMTNYTPTQDYNGQDTVTVQLNDGGANGSPAPYSVPITVWPVNDPPKLTVPSLSLTASVGSSVSISPAVTVNDVDFTGNPSFTMQLLVQASLGTLKMSSITGLTITYPASYTTSAFSPVFLVMGSQSAINNALSNLVYKRTTAGAESILLAVNDLRYYGSGGALTDYTLIPVA
eukprot:TRINITY_DN67_c0_g1_i1.p1 TRINITY_DN67_c0_g1~~TRINITY_DN67_c0_g1_i1.p1  ORF type:complete len:648 (-),score=98.25 TRINITY_DN67_c0_g1_i1:34-1977(-)